MNAPTRASRILDADEALSQLPPTPVRVEMRLNAEQSAVRQFQADLTLWLRNVGVGPISTANATLVMAEVLNNIVEHAFDRQDNGIIDVTFSRCGTEMVANVVDGGRALPGLSLPTDKKPPVNVPISQLPEGGFGWPLIHDLSDGVCYTRASSGAKAENRLTILFAASD